MALAAVGGYHSTPSPLFNGYLVASDRDLACYCSSELFMMTLFLAWLHRITEVIVYSMAGITLNHISP